MKKAEQFHYRKVKALPADSHIINTRFYIFTNHGNYWCPPFFEKWQTQSTIISRRLKILNAFAVRIDLDIAARCHTELIDLDIGETIAFGFDIPMLPWKQPFSFAGSESDNGLCGPAGQSRPKLRWIYGQDGALAIRGMARISGSPDGTERGHSVAKLLSQARPNDKALPVRSSEDEAPDPRG